MRTVKEISELTGISVRTLHYYDEIGLLKPTQKSDAGYRPVSYTHLDVYKRQLHHSSLCCITKNTILYLDTFIVPKQKPVFS